jgi:aspartate kinase
MFRVLKFGGTSVGSPERIKNLVPIIQSHKGNIVVLSAVSGTTNKLVEIAELLYGKKHNDAKKHIQALQAYYHEFIKNLFEKASDLSSASDMIDAHFKDILNYTEDVFTINEEKAILAKGELISTALFHIYTQSIGVKSQLLSALDFMRIDEFQEPEIDFLTKNIASLIPNKDVLHITQGFICRNHFGEVDNLKRGGSDYTASLIGAAIQAEEVQIWTDIDGMHNNDPRIVKNTRPLSYLNFNEAAELAYFGAKILHPQSILPAQKFNIPVRLLNTMQPDASGTLISSKSGNEKVKAIAAKDGITSIKIQSSRMLLAFGFLRKVFEVFERYKTSIDMITTSEVSVNLTIDSDAHLEEIIKDLSNYGQVSFQKNNAIVCVVGDFGADAHGYAFRVLDAVKHLPIQMISYGGSEYNVSVLVKEADKKEALKSLHSRLFD